MADLSSNVYFQGIATAASWIGWPFGLVLYYIGISLLFTAKLLYGPIITFLQPFIYIGRFLLYILTLPYYLLVRFEALYNFLGVAAILGLLIGSIIYYSARKFEDVPDVGSIISAYIDEHIPGLSEKRTAKEYRESKTRTIKVKQPSLPSSGYASLSDSLSAGIRSKRGVLGQTILEEVDSDY